MKCIGFKILYKEIHPRATCCRWIRFRPDLYASSHAKIAGGTIYWAEEHLLKKSLQYSIEDMIN